MRRALFAITGLAASTTAMVVLKAAPGTGQVAQEPPPGTAPTTDGPTPPVDAEESPSASREPRATRSPKPARSTEAPARRTDSSEAPRTPSAPRTTTAAPRPATRTVTGPVVGNEYGNVQVRITLTGSRITDAVALELPERTAQSEQRSDLVDSRYSGVAGLVVARQSADLDTVSGATATSQSYRQSLQAAIDRAR
ncbi:FMN-binding protein [Micromonospora sp. NPDC003816]|uniref:FMN-binding protein n=1 Tax=Micromonospora sp. NPDC003816 TaxID=3364224 RepID=UPI0036AD0A71